MKIQLPLFLLLLLPVLCIAQVNLIITGNAGCLNTSRSVSNTVVMTVNLVVTPALNISGTTSVQQGTPSLITAVPVNGGAGPVYSWQDSTAAQQWQSAQVISMNGNTALPRISITGRTRASINIEQLPAGIYLLMITRRQGPPAYLRFVKVL